MTTTRLDDPYQGLAEFHDLFMTEPWERLRPLVRQAFSGLGGDATIVEVGAGTGMGTRLIASECEAEIIAIEPSPVMRTVLIHRVADDPDLARRVTVVDGSAPSSIDRFSGPIDGFVCAHMLGHLTRDERTGTFAALARRMTPGAVGVVTVQAKPEAGTTENGEWVRQRRIGRYDYRVRFPTASDADVSHSEYQVVSGDEVVRTARFADPWTPVTADDLELELAAGLHLEASDSHGALIRRDRHGVTR